MHSRSGFQVLGESSIEAFHIWAVAAYRAAPSSRCYPADMLLLACLASAPAAAPLSLLSEPVEPSFGADVSAGVAAGAIISDWAVPGPSGAWTVRYDAFVQDRSTPGVRVGVSLFGGSSAWSIVPAVTTGALLVNGVMLFAYRRLRPSVGA